MTSNCNNFQIQAVSDWSATFPTYPPINTTFYKKFVNVDGFPVTGSDKPSDASLLEASKWACHLLSMIKPAYKQSHINLHGKLTVMAAYPKEKTVDVPEHAFLGENGQADFWNERARGLGATVAAPTTSCAEENVLCSPDDRYKRECIMIHEFGHSISLLSGDAAFLAKLDSSYNNAMSTGLFSNTYSTTNPQEYWAEGVQSWFDCNDWSIPSNGIHGEVHTREKIKTYDPTLAGLLMDVFGDSSIRYSCPAVNPTSTSLTSTATTATGSTKSSSTSETATVTVTSATSTVTGSAISTSISYSTTPPTVISSSTSSGYSVCLLYWSLLLLFV